MILHTTDRTRVIGTMSGSSYELSLSTYYLIGKSLVDARNEPRWTNIYTDITGRSRNHRAKRSTLLSTLDQTIKVHRLAIGISVHNGIYGLMSSRYEILIPDMEAPGHAPDILRHILTKISAQIIFDVDLGECLPPNQTEYLTRSDIRLDEYFIPINPQRNTVRRTLSYANYVADSNTAIDADPGAGHSGSSSGYGQTWLINGDIRRQWIWGRRLQAPLTSGIDLKCSNFDFIHPIYTGTWKGIDTFQKQNNSSAWIPSELFAWPCSALYRFYSAAGFVDEVPDCSSRSLSVAFLMPLTLSDPPTAVGISDLSMGNVATHNSSQKYMSIYSRPYVDDSDGSGIYHPMA